MTLYYTNYWIPEPALNVLSEWSGRILDIGGAVAPYVRATCVVDSIEEDVERMSANVWGPSGTEHKFCSSYVRQDLDVSPVLPFADKEFDYCLSSHTLEHLKDPVTVIKEMQRVAGKIMIIYPSRILEQTKGIDSPRHCGFVSHNWMMHVAAGRLIFKRKTDTVNMCECHLHCPWGKRMKLEVGADYYYGDSIRGEYYNPADRQADIRDNRAFIEPYSQRKDIFEKDPGAESWRYWVWRMKQYLFNAT